MPLQPLDRLQAAVILRNHGLLTCGRSVAEAFELMYILEFVCRAQLKAQATGQRLVVPSPEICEIDNLWSSVVRAVAYSGLSAYGALAGSLHVCSRAHAKTVAIVFALAVIAWTGFFIFGGFITRDVWMPSAVVLLGAAPALFVAYWAWREEL